MPKLHSYQLRIDKQNQRDWKPTTALEEAEAEVKFNISFQGQQGHSGLGLIPIKWDDVMSPDLSWNNLIYNLPPKLVSFALNATQLTLPTPDRLRVWNITSQSMCKLCSHPKCSLSYPVQLPILTLQETI